MEAIRGARSRTSDEPLRCRFDGPPGWVPGPLDVPPHSVFPPYTEPRGRWVVDNGDDRFDALMHALTGASFGAHDVCVLRWLSGWDNPTVATVVSSIHRARLAERDGPSPNA